jgi:hypothetical protein
VKASSYLGVRAEFALASLDEVNATLTITLPIKRWREIAKSLSTEDYAQWPLREVIVDLITQAQQHFQFTEKEPS